MRSRERLIQILPTVNVPVVVPDEIYRIIAQDNLNGAVKALRGELVYPLLFADVIAINLRHPGFFVSDHVRELLTETIHHLRSEA